MVTMTRPSRMMNQMMGSRRQSTLARHPVTGILGLLLLTFVAATMLSLIPDFIRYMKLREM